jgi:uncharacterized protein with gpF-like domain
MVATSLPRRPLNCPDGKARLLPAVHPNAGIAAKYVGCLEKLLARMHGSLLYWLRARYRKSPPRMAQDTTLIREFENPSLAADASPAVEFIWELRKLGRRWQARFDEAAKQLGDWFARTAFQRSDAALKQILKDAGWTVEFKQTANVTDTLRATIGAQVNLIRSIGTQHLNDVAGMVLRSVQSGGDLEGLTKGLELAYGVSQRRAALIARDQNAKATATITRVRQQELGITKARWVHTAAGKEPRPHHVDFSAGRRGGPIYDVATGAPGMADNGGYSHPGWEINCRCISRSIIPGLK